MKTNSNLLLRELSLITRTNIEYAESLSVCTSQDLNYKSAPQSWSVLQCLEHLNRYAEFYHPWLDKKIFSGKKGANAFFKSGFIGNYLVNMVKPGAGSKKMKTFKSMDPADKEMAENVLERFIANQRELLSFLDKAQYTKLNNNCIPVTFSRFIKLSPGNILRFMVYHNQRHILQAQRITQKLTNTKKAAY